MLIVRSDHRPLCNLFLIATEALMLLAPMLLLLTNMTMLLLTIVLLQDSKYALAGMYSPGLPRFAGEDA